MNIKTYKVAEICSIVRGTYATLKTEPGKYPLVVTAAYRRSANTYQLEGPAVCVPLISSTGHGHAAIHRVHYQEGQFALANLLVALKPKDTNICDAKYLYYLLMAKKDEYLVPLMSGTANVSLKEKDIAGVDIPLPPLEEQHRTVSRIEKCATKIEEANDLRRGAATVADVVVNSALARIIVALKQRVGSKRLGDLIEDAGYGTSRKCEATRVKNAIPVLRIPNVASERVNLENLKYAGFTEAELQRVVLAPGDLLVVRTNGSIDLVGRSAVVPSLSEKTAFASYLIRIRCKTDVIWPPFFQMMLKHLRTNGNLIDFARTTAGQYNVSLGRLRAAELPVPSLEEQYSVVATLDELQAKVSSLKKVQAETAAELEALTPSILSKAFSRRAIS